MCYIPTLRPLIHRPNTKLDRYFQILMNYVILLRDNLRSKVFRDENAEQTLPLYLSKINKYNSLCRSLTSKWPRDYHSVGSILKVCEKMLERLYKHKIIINIFYYVYRISNRSRERKDTAHY